jgi:hypothetical protein
MEAGQDSDLDMPTDSSLSPVPSTLLSSSLSREKLNSSHNARGVQPSKETNKSSTHREEEEQVDPYYRPSPTDAFSFHSVCSVVAFL